jgi:hypothetical protein
VLADDLVHTPDQPSPTVAHLDAAIRMQDAEPVPADAWSFGIIFQ